MLCGLHYDQFPVLQLTFQFRININQHSWFSDIHFEGQFGNTTMSEEIREFTLRKGRFEESTLYKLKKSWIIRFKLGPDCMTDDVRLFCNYPSNG